MRISTGYHFILLYQMHNIALVGEIIKQTGIPYAEEWEQFF
jgi:hypothetical protein